MTKAYDNEARPFGGGHSFPLRVPGLDDHPGRHDPPPREDSRCVLCHKPRKITREAKRYAGHWLDLDPFCSRLCAEAFHGVDPRLNEEDPR